MGFSSLFKKSSSTPPSTLWASCKHPRTESFRAGDDDEDNVHYANKTVTKIDDPTVYLDMISESCSFTDVDSSAEETWSLSSDSEEESEFELFDTVDVRGLKSDRLFFEPSGDTRNIMKECTKEEGEVGGGSPWEEGVAVAVESEDPYWDFRTSMEEMVAAHGSTKDWEYMEELLEWYLRANVKKAHEFIIRAFLDLVWVIASSSVSYSSAAATDTSKTVVREKQDGSNLV